MRTFKSEPARTVLGKVLQEHFPLDAGWQLVEHEGTVDDSARTRVRVAQRTILHSDTGYSGDHRVGFQVTITIPTDGLDTAEVALDDEMEAFLWALDAGDVPWTSAEKGKFADEGGRLGYQLDITIRTSRPEEDQ